MVITILCVAMSLIIGFLLVKYIIVPIIRPKEIELIEECYKSPEPIVYSRHPRPEGEMKKLSKELKLSVGYPKLLSKKFSSPFKVTIYPPNIQLYIKEKLKKELEKWDMEEYVDYTDLTPGLTVVINLSSPDIEFSEEVVKKLENKINEAFFTGKPKETCHPGKQIVKLSITDETKGYEYLSRIFEVEVVDYVFDHVSRPFLSKITSTAIGLASMVTYALTLLEQIDTTFGFASGTAAAFVAAFIFTQFRSSFQRPSVTAELLR